MITIHKANIKAVDSIISLIAQARHIMRSNGNPNQWSDNYPDRDTIVRDINAGNGFICTDGDGTICGYFALIAGADPTYAIIRHGQWLEEKRAYAVIHRIASTGSTHGVFRAIMDFAFRLHSNIRIDTHKDNSIMRHCLIKYGFTECGIIYLENGDERIAFQKISNQKME